MDKGNTDINERHNTVDPLKVKKYIFDSLVLGDKRY
jgi:hypothetical protein